jgi:hypothetical protein
MAANSVIILPSSSHSADSTNTPLVGEKFKGAGFYGLGTGYHTVQIQLTSFSGIIKIQGTLATNPSPNDWIDINLKEEESLSVDTTGLISPVSVLDFISLTNSTINRIYNFSGNFVWIRVNISTWTDGQINKIMLNF